MKNKLFFILRMGTAIASFGQLTASHAKDSLSGSISADLLDRPEERTDADAQDIYGDLSLWVAVFLGDLDMAHALIDAGADLDAKSKSGKTPLHEAASMGHLEITQALIDAGADLNLKNRYGYAPLHEA